MLLRALFTTVRGFAMGAADIVPGVSGGTIALVFGIYERLITSVRAGSSALGALVKGDIEGFKRWFGAVDWSFIIPLGLGVLIALFSLAHVIEQLLEDQPVIMASIFLGLVAGSVVIAWKLIGSPTSRHAWIALGVGAIVFVLLGLRGGTTEESVSQAAEPALIAFFFAGAIAICAMILPGISGSFLLVVMGMYGPVLSAVTDRDFASLAVFGLGAIIGLALFSQLLYRALRSHHDLVLAVLIGLMAGSVRVLWPWPLGVESTELGTPDSQVPLALLCALIAMIAVIVIGRFAQRLESDPSSDATVSAGAPD
ncbi:MAG: DUF368 domain-containing protein [Acidimicrobiia bacterium]